MKEFTIDGVQFIVDTRIGKDRDVSTKKKFILVNTDDLIDYYMDMRSDSPRNIMEVGVFQGGSLVLFDKIFKPDRIVGLDMTRKPIVALDEYIAENKHMKMYYARSQDKQGTLMAARENFTDGIDLVVDDASHLYEQTKATFSMLFPLVRPGGHYIIEDWAWAHGLNSQAPTSNWADKPAMSNLIIELVIMVASFPTIEQLTIKRGFVAIKKARGKLPDKPFDNLSKHLRGRTLHQI